MYVMYVCMYVGMYVCMYIDIYIYIHTYTYICIHVNIYTHTLLILDIFDGRKPQQPLSQPRGTRVEERSHGSGGKQSGIVQRHGDLAGQNGASNQHRGA